MSVTETDLSHVASVTLQKSLFIIVISHRFFQDFKRNSFQEAFGRGFFLSLQVTQICLWRVHNFFFFIIVTKVQFLKNSQEQMFSCKVYQEQIRESVSKIYYIFPIVLSFEPVPQGRL